MIATSVTPCIAGPVAFAGWESGCCRGVVLIQVREYRDTAAMCVVCVQSCRDCRVPQFNVHRDQRGGRADEGQLWGLPKFIHQRFRSRQSRASNLEYQTSIL
jgi:hypothetical protein